MKSKLQTWFRARRPWQRRLMIGVAAVLGTLLLLLAFIWWIFGRGPVTQPEDIVWGVTYSELAAKELKLDPDATYKAIVEDLQPQRLRLVAYWNQIEGQKGKYDFSSLDKQVALAEKHKIPYIIAVGQRVPRYPECHIPEWTKGLSNLDIHKRVLKLIKRTMERYDQNEHLFKWQIENEAFVNNFGECPPLDEDFLDSEIDLGRKLTDKPVMTTESGELSVWYHVGSYPDVLGTTLYRAVLVGKSDLRVNHIFPPAYYRARANIAKWRNPNLDKVIVAELQGEPWGTKPIVEHTNEELARTMNPEQFERNIKYTESVGFPESYFWGAEWWFREKTLGNEFYWNRAKELFK